MWLCSNKILFTKTGIPWILPISVSEIHSEEPIDESKKCTEFAPKPYVGKEGNVSGEYEWNQVGHVLIISWGWKHGNSLYLWFSKCGARTSSISITRKLVRNANCKPHFISLHRISGNKSQQSIFMILPGYFNAH